MKNYCILIILFVSFISSCKKDKNPKLIFDTLWNDFDKHYSLFEIKNKNWDSLYTIFGSQVNTTTSDEELFAIITKTLAVLNDKHVSINYNNERFFISGNEQAEISKYEYSFDLIQSKYLEYLTQISDPNNDKFYFGKIKNKDIGYIQLRDMDGNGNKIDDVLSNLKNHKAIIFDIRQNTGGYDDFAARIASAFADGTHFIYTSQTRNGLKHSDFDIISKKYSHKIGNEQFTKPVILLTDRRTISAAEIFILHMKSFAHVTQIGDTTAGAFSTQSMTRFLQNGWYYKYSIQKILTPDAKSLEGIGNAPTLYIRNTPTNIQNNQDVVLEKAIQYLYDVYGIE